MQNHISLHKIILVIKNPSEAKHLKQILQQRKYSCELIQSYEEFEKRINWLNFELVIIDSQLIEGKDLAACRALTNLPGGIAIPILIIAHNFNTDYLIKVFQEGISDFIAFPYNDAEIALRIDILLDTKKQKDKLKAQKKSLEVEILDYAKQLKQANEKLLSLDKARNNFLRLISHELKTPLNGLNGVMEVLKAAGAEEEWNDYLSIIKPSVSRLSRFSEYAILITSLLSGVKLRKSLCPLNEILTQSIDSIESIRQTRDIEVLLYSPPESIKIFVQVEYFVQAVVAILENAIKHTPVSSKIIVKTSYDYGKVNIHITDQGQGFSESAKNQLFEFFSTDNIMEHSEGLGLGLAAAKLVLEAHKGQITVLNSKEGVTVTLTLKKF